MKQKAKDAHFGAQMSYYILHIFVLLIQTLYDNDLKLNILNGDLIWALVLLVNIILSTYLFHVTGKKPGFYSLEKKTELNTEKSLSLELHQKVKTTEDTLRVDEEDSKIDRTMEFVDHEKSNNSSNEDQPSSTTELTPGNWKDYETEKYLMHMDKKGKIHKYFKQDAVKVKKSSEKNGKKPEKHYCKKCDVWQPYRTKHCNSCEACVSKFDHHCFWIGTCVGEQNHGKFFQMLLFFTTEFMQVFYYAYTGLSYNDENYEKDHDLKENTYTKEYGAMIISCLICACFVAFVAILQVIHFIFIIHGSTTWEMTKWENIDFQNAYPRGFNPFDEGLVGNFKNVFCHDNEIREWELPDPEEVRSRKKKWNWFSNEYYSLC